MFKLRCPRCPSKKVRKCPNCGVKRFYCCEWRFCNSYVCKDCESECKLCGRYYCSHCVKDGYCFGCYQTEFNKDFEN